MESACPVKRDTAYFYKRNKEILCKEIEGEVCLVDPYRRVLIQINPVGREIWLLLDGSHAQDDIISVLTEKFDCRASDIRKDVAVFIRELEKRELIA
jgi:hypothetical protein